MNLFIIAMPMIKGFDALQLEGSNIVLMLIKVEN